MGVRATGVAEVGAVGITVFAAVLGYSRISVAKENQCAEQLENYTRKLPKKEEERRVKI